MIWMICLLLPVLVLGGCEPQSSQERMHALGCWIRAGQAVSAEADAKIAALSASLDEGLLLLQDPAISPEQTAKIRETLEKAGKKIAAVAEQKAVIEVALAEWQKEVEAAAANASTNLGDELIIYGQGTTTVSKSLPPEYAAWGTLGGFGLTLAGWFVRALLTKKKMADGEALPAVIKSVEQLLDNIPTDNEMVSVRDKSDAMTREKAVSILAAVQKSKVVSQIVDGYTKAPIDNI